LKWSVFIGTVSQTTKLWYQLFLTHLKSQAKGLLAQWYLRFLPNIELQFKPGTTNGAADALSRSPIDYEVVANVCLVSIIDESDNVLSKVQSE